MKSHKSLLIDLALKKNNVVTFENQMFSCDENFQLQYFADVCKLGDLLFSFGIT